MTGIRKLAVIAAIAGMTVCPAFSAPLPLPVNGGWQTFEWSGLGPIDNPADGYSLVVLSGLVVIRLVDRLIIGDRYEVFVDGSSTMTTSDILANDGVSSGAGDGDTAWAHPDLSKGSFTLGPGTYDIDIDVVRINGAQVDSGGAFIRADAPEPATLPLLALGLATLGLLSRRRAAVGRS